MTQQKMTYSEAARKEDRIINMEIMRELRELKNNNMAQTSVDFFIEKMVDLMIGLTFYENQRQDLQDAYKVAQKMHKNECISFAEQWEVRCNEKDMDSKEQLYDEIYNKK